VRTTLQSSIAAVIAALALVTSAFAESTTFSIGTSQGGAPLTVYQLGSGPRRVLILGGQHGGPERNTVELVESMLDYFTTNPEELPVGLELDILTVANPDGLATGRRQFLSGVDPNRNWGGGDWRADAFDSNALFRVGLGGPEPFSEQETRALADWVLAVRPALVINYHSAGGFMFGPRDGFPGELATMYADLSGYAWPGGGGPGGGTRSLLGYSASGSMNVWLRESGIPAILVELSTPWYPEVERNLTAVKAVLRQLAPAS
jgi:Zinc carboxypeptidase